MLCTASSDSVLPQIMRKLEHVGIKDSTVGLVIPTGYSFNLHAFSFYLTLATVFISAWEGDIDRARAQRVLNGVHGSGRRPAFGRQRGLNRTVTRPGACAQESARA